MPFLSIKKLLNGIQNQTGAVPVLILLVVIGIIAFLSITSLSYFKSDLFGTLFQKRFSFAANTITFVDPSGAAVTQTNAPTVLVKVDAPWPVPLTPPGSPPLVTGFLSDQIYSIGLNGFGGPIEKDTNSGGDNPNDGTPIKIAGVTYAKGFGTNAYSEMLFNLDGKCSNFSSQVGIDDMALGGGTVIFQVFLDDVKVYDSPLKRGNQPATAVSVDVTGKKTMMLVVSNNNDGTYRDHADWADAKITCSSTPSNGNLISGQLSTQTWTNETNGNGPVERNTANGNNRRYDGKPITINGQIYRTGLGVHSTSLMTFKSAGNCTQFSADVGIDDSVGDVLGSVIFQVWADGAKIAESPLKRGSDPATLLTADITGKQSFNLVVTDGGNGGNDDHADWANAKVVCNDTAVSPSASGSTTSLIGDINNTGKVDLYDYNILLTNFGKSGANLQGDLNNTGKVDLYDYNILLTNFGRSGPVASSTPSSTTNPNDHTEYVTFAEDAAFTQNVTHKNLYSYAPQTYQYMFSNRDSGTKTLYAKFTSENGQQQIVSATVDVVLPPLQPANAFGEYPTIGTTVPAGQSAPVVGQQCPDWIHQQYVTTGPDGQKYPTWHPVTEPFWKCNFYHEHGSDPRKFIGFHLSGMPAFSYVVSKTGIPSPHNGFKVYVINDTAIEYNQTQTTSPTVFRTAMLRALHMGTANPMRAIIRWHELQSFTVRADNPNIKVSEIHTLMDFGMTKGCNGDLPDDSQTYANAPQNPPVNPSFSNNPVFRSLNVICPGALSETGAVSPYGVTNQQGYEQWQGAIDIRDVATNKHYFQQMVNYNAGGTGTAINPNNLPRKSNNYACPEIKLPNGRVDLDLSCLVKQNELTCAKVGTNCPTGNPDVDNLKIAGSGREFKYYGEIVNNATASETVYADPFGRVVPQTDPMAIKQYITKSYVYTNFGRNGAFPFSKKDTNVFDYYKRMGAPANAFNTPQEGIYVPGDHWSDFGKGQARWPN